jgi:hypothetical protein
MNKHQPQSKKIRGKASNDVAPGPVTVQSKPVAVAKRTRSAQGRRRPVSEQGGSVPARIRAMLRKQIQQIKKKFFKRKRRRKLELLEIQQLGEKRFMGIMRVGKQKFLIGGAASSVSLLAEIASQKTTMLAPRPLDQESA